MTSTAARILVVEDESVLREAVVDALAGAGFRVHALADSTDFTNELQSFRPDAAVLDVMLPGRSGLDLARELRSLSPASVIFVTARDSVPDRLAGFDVGADDYIVKPFALAELVARVRAVLRRAGRLVSSTIEIDDLLIDEDINRATRGQHELNLTATELRLLIYLARNRDRVVSKTQILTQVWGYEDYDPNLVETFISTLRRKLEEHGDRVIHTVRGIGYRLAAGPR